MDFSTAFPMPSSRSFCSSVVRDSNASAATVLSPFLGKRALGSFTCRVTTKIKNKENKKVKKKSKKGGRWGVVVTICSP